MALSPGVKHVAREFTGHLGEYAVGEVKHA